jgi:hypothetical protein
LGTSTPPANSSPKRSARRRHGLASAKALSGVKEAEAVTNSVVAVAKGEKGFKGYLALADRAASKGITISLWETEADRAADPGRL